MARRVILLCAGEKNRLRALDVEMKMPVWCRVGMLCRAYCSFQGN